MRVIKFRKKYRLTSKALRLLETSVALQESKFENTYIYGFEYDVHVVLYQKLMQYIDNPNKDNKKDLSNFVNAHWKKIKPEVKAKGRAYRIWIFNKVYSKLAVSKLVKDQPLNIKSAEFLSFTEKIPVGQGVFKKYWSVFRNTVAESGGLVLIQQMQYTKGISVTKFIKFLLDDGYIIDEDEVDEAHPNVFYEMIDSDGIMLINEEQEILVFDDIVKIEMKDIISIKVTVPKNDNSYDGIIVPRVNAKFVDAGTMEEARLILRSQGVHV
jgi:hypothetical protein